MHKYTENKKEINAWFQAYVGIDAPKGGTQLGVIRSIDFNDIINEIDKNVNNQNERNSKNLNSTSELFDDERAEKKKMLA